MKIDLLLSETKNYVCKKTKRMNLLHIINCIILCVLCFFMFNFHNETMNRIEKVEKKVDFRYFNTTRSLEGIHNVKIETKHGTVSKSNHRNVANL